MFIYRHYRMGNTRVACIGQRWTGTRRGDRWHSFCAQGMTRLWSPPRIFCAKNKRQESTRISHGQICSDSLNTITGLMKLPSKTSPIGSYLNPTPPIKIYLYLASNGVLHSWSSLVLWFFERGTHVREWYFYIISVHSWSSCKST